jgi:hypothetical protein
LLGTNTDGDENRFVTLTTSSQVLTSTNRIVCNAADLKIVEINVVTGSNEEAVPGNEVTKFLHLFYLFIMW